MNQQDLEKRLINLAVSIIQITEGMRDSRASNHLAGQLLRSGTSPALNYGEARRAESKKDFVHKLRVVLKELGESYNTLRIILLANCYSEEVKIQGTIKETNELIAIFTQSIKTAQTYSRSRSVTHHTS
jgi:four helix bundle protein